MKFYFYTDGDEKSREVPDLDWAIRLLRAAIEDGKDYVCLDVIR